MKQFVIAVLLTTIVGISGCAQSLPPHEELNLAIKKSFEASGLNYSSKSRVTNLSMLKQDANAETADKRLKFLGTGLDIVRGLSVNAYGAIDMKAKKSEVLYDLHYDKDNVEISIKVPLLLDYETLTVYLGTTFLNTILETVYPQAPLARGKLIRLSINDLLKESAASAPELAKIFGEHRFSSKNIESLNGAIRACFLKSLAKLNDSNFSDQPLSEQDRKAGVTRRIHVTLSHADTVAVILDLVDTISQTLFQDGVISKTEYAVLLTLTDKKMLAGVTDKFTLALALDVGIAPSGFVSHVESQLNVQEREGMYQLGLNNVSSFSSYNAPHFSINPETSGIVDFKELRDVFMKDSAKEQDKTPSAPDVPEDDSAATPDPEETNVH